jgi:dTDP-4-dehydrorhamnose 3,5-epimerase
LHEFAGNVDRTIDMAFGGEFVQDNLPRSAYGVLRGLHLQNPKTQKKLVTVSGGRVVDVAVDVRVGSPTFGPNVTVEFSEENRRQLWVPRGFAHGFAVLSLPARKRSAILTATVRATFFGVTAAAASTFS